MGGAKEAWMEQMERGWDSVGDKNVCEKCLPEPDLADLIRQKALSTQCSYCRRNDISPIAAEMDEILSVICEGIEYEWMDPADGVPYNGREGGYLVSSYTGRELIEDGRVEIDIQNDELREDVLAAFCQQFYCERDWCGDSEKTYLEISWSLFKSVVKNKRRFFFDYEDLTVGDDEPWMPSVSPASILNQLGNFSNKVGLISLLPKGYKIIRARAHKIDNAPSSAKEMGSPPVEFALFPNRMSPAGISMFYGAKEQDTAKLEILNDPNRPPAAITFATFETSMDLHFLDLVNIPEVPSLFSQQREDRDKIIFLKDFVRDFCQSVAKDGAVHVDYVPTQIITEFFRYQFKTKDGVSLSGIRYNSSKNGKECFVLFIENENCVDIENNWDSEGALKLGLKTISTVTAFG